MKLQLALDIFNLDEALGLAEKLKEYIDIIEIGTPFVLEYGMEAVRQFCAKFPDKKILADTKIMDAGELESAAAFKAGADYVTVLAVTDIATIKACAVRSDWCSWNRSTLLIVGGGITNAADPVQEAKLIYEKISL